jgi:hypothetical protein
MHRSNVAKRLIAIEKIDLSTYPQTLRSRQRSSFLDPKKLMKMEERQVFEGFKPRADDIEDCDASAVEYVLTHAGQRACGHRTESFCSAASRSAV